MASEKQSKSPIAKDLSMMEVALPLPCARCGYDIRGLAADGDCPECGEPIRLTIIEVVDPAARRLIPMNSPRLIGNAITGIVVFFFMSVVFAVLALITQAPNSIPVPDFLMRFSTTWLLWGAAGAGFIACAHIIPMVKMCQEKQLQGCRQGILLTSSGLIVWSISMLLAAYVLLYHDTFSSGIQMSIDTIIPVVSASIVFSGFKKLVPRLGQRSRAFRQAQGSRQRMKDLLATLVVLLVGRTCVAVSARDSNLSMFGLIVMVMSLSFIVIGLAYLLRNTIWIRSALITPPPALTDLLQSIER